MDTTRKRNPRHSPDSTKWRIYTALALYGHLNGNEIKRALRYGNNPTVNCILFSFKGNMEGAAIKCKYGQTSAVGGAMDYFIKRDKKTRTRYVIDIDLAIRDVIESHISQKEMPYSNETKTIIKNALYKVWVTNNLLCDDLSVNINSEDQMSVAKSLFEYYRQLRFDDKMFEIIADVINFRIHSHILGNKLKSDIIPGWVNLTDQEFVYLASIANACNKIPYSTFCLFRDVLEKDGTVFQYDSNHNPVFNMEEKI